jgi:hypothetical protein
MVGNFEECWRELYEGSRLVVTVVPGGFSTAFCLLLIIWLRLLLRVFEDLLETSKTSCRPVVDGVSIAHPTVADLTAMSREICPRLGGAISGESDSDCS